MRETLVLAAIAAAVGGCSCGSEVVHVEPIAPGCEVLDPGECLLPWPTSHYIENDASDTARAVVIPASAMPVNNAEVPIPIPADPWNAWDGFSAMTSMVVRLRGDVDDAPLSSWRAPVEPDDTSSPTLLLDATTGELVSHYAEIQRDDERDPDHTLLYVRPAARLEERHHYVVAVRGLRDTSGIEIAPMAPFRALRDGLTTDSPAVEARRSSFEAEVFAPLALAEIPRADLIAAWDFWTADGTHATGDLVAMRDAALDSASIDMLGCTPGTPGPSGEITHVITIPTFLIDGSLARDDDGRPRITGERDVIVRLLVPDTASGPVPLVIYGHGLRTSRDEIDIGFVEPLLDGTAIGASIDFEGLTAATWGDTGAVLADLGDFTAWVDRMTQNIVATLVLPHALARCALGDVTVDPARVSYVGNSQGAIVGLTIAALSPDITRLALGVGGISYPIMMPRSVGFPDVFNLLSVFYPNGWDLEILMVMFANHWDRIEGAAFAPHVLRDRFDGSGPPPSVLFQIGAEDTGTPNAASEIAGRSLGLPVLASSAVVPSGMESAAGPLPSAYVVYDYGVDALPDRLEVPEPNCVHESVRRDPAAQEQIIELFESGQITDHCNGECTERPLFSCD